MCQGCRIRGRLGDYPNLFDRDRTALLPIPETDSSREEMLSHFVDAALAVGQLFVSLVKWRSRKTRNNTSLWIFSSSVGIDGSSLAHRQQCRSKPNVQNPIDFVWSDQIT